MSGNSMYINLITEIDSVNEFGRDSNYYLDNLSNKLVFDPNVAIGSFLKINLFVGANNSGKSRFLRGLFKIDSTSIVQNSSNITLLSLLSEFRPKEFKEIIRFIDEEVDLSSQDGSHMNNVNELANMFSKSKSLPFELIKNYNQYDYLFESVIWLIDKVKEYQQYIDEAEMIVSGNSIQQTRSGILISYCDIIIEILTLITEVKDTKVGYKFYIPTLRSLTRNSNFSNETFKTVVKENYSIENNLFTGLEYYDLLKNQKSSLINVRKNIKKFELFLSRTFFENKPVEITSNVGTPSQIHFSVGEEEFPIYDIGDGIQQLIILLLPIFICDDNCWVFIEEPETHLHPGLQRVFIDALLSDDYLQTKNLRYFFTTHSNHFLDLSIDSNEISVFQFAKVDAERFLIQNKKPGKETLELLGVNTSSVFLANASIWVEGPTDRKYLSKFLKIYCENKKLQPLREDIDFAFFEYGGNLIEHYLFDEDSKYDENITNEVNEKIKAFASCNKIYLLADNDNAKGKKKERREKLQKLSDSQNSFQYQNTVVKEIENLLPVKILKDFLPNLTKGQVTISKMDFNQSDYAIVGLGDFFQDKFREAGITEINSFKASKGNTLTASYKNKLCDFVINGNYKYSDLIQDNPILEKIIEDLYYFIKPESKPKP